MELSKKEEYLIEQIRNYKKAYPNGSQMLETDILGTVYELMEEEIEENDY
ncbi:MAG: hypothetical protein K2H04_03705 [Bacteroidaceae bacterium]|nr:hypothetical protein [Bacteroidaceae bacterium]